MRDKLMRDPSARERVNRARAIRSRRGALVCALALLAAPFFGAAHANAQSAQSGQSAIRIGEINSYKAQAAFLEPYKKGMDLALEQINSAGGIGGRKLEVVTRDDNANPGDAVRAAEELLSGEKVDALAGGFLSNVGVALTDFAKQRKVFYLATEPLANRIVWESGNQYVYRLRPSTYMQTAMLVPEAAKLKKKRWALIYPNYEYGQSAVETFKALLKAAQPDVEFVSEQATPLGKIDAGSVVQALGDSKPDAIFNVLFAGDLAKFVREGATRELFKDRAVVSLLTGEPEYLDPLKDEAPQGWIVTGYPWQFVKTPDHQAFLDAYRKKFNDYPRMGSVVGYSAIVALAQGLRKAGTGDPDKLVAAFNGMEFNSPFGVAKFRPQDHQSTMGAYVGTIGVADGKGIMKDFSYRDGADYQPSDDFVKSKRPAN